MLCLLLKREKDSRSPVKNTIMRTRHQKPKQPKMLNPNPNPDEGIDWENCQVRHCEKTCWPYPCVMLFFISTIVPNVLPDRSIQCMNNVKGECSWHILCSTEGDEVTGRPLSKEQMNTKTGTRPVAPRKFAMGIEWIGTAAVFSQVGPFQREGFHERLVVGLYHICPWHLLLVWPSLQILARATTKSQGKVKADIPFVSNSWM